MNERHILPLFFQVMEQAKLQLKVADADKLVQCIEEYIKKLNMPQITKLLIFIKGLMNVNGEIVLNGFDKN